MNVKRPDTITSIAALSDFIQLANLLRADESVPSPLFLDSEGKHRHLLDRMMAAFNVAFPAGSAFRSGIRRAAKKGRAESTADQETEANRAWQDSDRVFVYFLFYSVRRTLIRLVDWESTGFRSKDISVGSAAMTASISIGDDFAIGRVVEDSLLDHFFNTLVGLDVRRFRRCPICQKPYFADRKDKRTCSPKCSSLNRVNRWRDKHQPKRRGKRKTVSFDVVN